VRLEDGGDYEAQARSRNIGLATLLRQIAKEAARQVKRKRIREQSEAVGRYVANHPEAKEFCEFWGTPRQEGL
jgi:hypothetical protein